MKNNIDRKQEKLIINASTNPTYKGKHVVMVADEIHILSTRDKNSRAKLLTKLAKKYPNNIPNITLIPEENTLILLI